MARQVGLTNGVPNLRWVNVPRVGQGRERVAQFLDQAIAALLDPLTDKENESGLYVPPPEPRISFTGTLDDAQEFYQKTTPISACKNCPIAQLTDGAPIVIPTEEAVKEMLTGTSHPPEEFFTLTSTQSVRGGTRQVGEHVAFMPNMWDATVEKIAVNAVMAGCKPEYLPVVLAMATRGLSYQATNTPWGYVQVVSGPIVQEIGLNVKQPFQSGNPAAMAIGRAFEFMLINIGGCLQGQSNTNLGHPGNRAGFFYGEDADALPEGWLGDNEVAGYKKTESIVRVGSGRGVMTYTFPPSAFLGLNQGVGPLARAAGVEGVPGKYNILEHLIPALHGDSWGSSFVMSPGIAQSLYDYGFTSKAAVGQWMRDHGWMTIGDYMAMGWFDYSTAGGTQTVSGTGLRYLDLPKTYLIQHLGSSMIIVANSLGDETLTRINAGGGSAYSIDAWR